MAKIHILKKFRLSLRITGLFSSNSSCLSVFGFFICQFSVWFRAVRCGYPSVFNSRWVAFISERRRLQSQSVISVIWYETCSTFNGLSKITRLRNFFLLLCGHPVTAIAVNRSLTVNIYRTTDAMQYCWLSLLVTGETQRNARGAWAGRALWTER